jgi:hypothetical protein
MAEIEQQAEDEKQGGKIIKIILTDAARAGE